ncbi:hypothetical protein SIO70_21055 [Chitinophaga sancti]|nr:hypothetical protein [Chitinophaga sancti]WPQ60848.1 hypothetical protein SIO70_21055 [Chitinophaga sancti]
MKYLLLPLFILCCSITFGQNLEDTPFKGAKKVIQDCLHTMSALMIWWSL